MWKNMLTAEFSRREFFQVIARNVMRSRVTQFIAAVSLGAFGLLLAYLCWEGRELVGAVVSVLVGIFALNVGLELLPYSDKSRARWAWKKDLAERYPSYRFKNILYYGLGWCAVSLWRDRDRLLSSEWEQLITNLIVPIAFTVVGAVATIVWHTRHAKHHVFRYPGYRTAGRWDRLVPADVKR